MGEQSLILNLYPPPSETFYVSNGVFLRENEPVLLNFFLGRPPDPIPSPHLPQCSDSMLEKKKQKVA